MTKRKSKIPALGVIILALVVSVGAGAVGYYYVRGNAPVPAARQIEETRLKPPAITQQPVEKKYVVMLPREAGDSFVLSPVTRTTGARGSILDTAVVALLATNQQGGVLGNLIPKGTMLLSPIRITDGIALVNLNKDFVDNFSGGSDQEALTLGAIVQTVIRNSGGKASKVQIKVEGETVDSLGGHFDLTEPLAADVAQAKPDTEN